MPGMCMVSPSKRTSRSSRAARAASQSSTPKTGTQLPTLGSSASAKPSVTPGVIVDSSVQPISSFEKSSSRPKWSWNHLEVAARFRTVRERVI